MASPVSQLVINGLVTGSIYVLVALSLSLLFGILGIPDFSQGAVLMLGGFVSYFLVTAGVTLFLAIPIAMVVVGIFGVIVSRLTFSYLEGRSEVALLILALALFIVYQNAASLLWTSQTRTFPVPDVLSGSFGVLGGSASYANWLVIVLALVMVAAIHLFTRYTLTGTAMRAVAQDRDTASLMGIDVQRITMLTFGVASALSAMAGGLLGAIFSIDPFMGTDEILRGFVIIILGGAGNVLAATVGAYFLGLLESFSTFYVTDRFTTAIVFLAVMVVLVFRPTGLGGE
jgi:branched-chain amino acid transport system permease protein